MASRRYRASNDSAIYSLGNYALGTSLRGKRAWVSNAYIALTPHQSL